MSEYVVCDSPTIKSTHHLKKALESIGIPSSSIEEHEFPVSLQGYQGDSRQQTAHIVIRRKNIGSASNDIGFEVREDGISIYVSDYDKGHGIGKDIIPMAKGGTGRLESSYAKSVIEDKMGLEGFTVSKCEMSPQKIKIKMVR
jgi:hypothetical protein